MVLTPYDKKQQLCFITMVSFMVWNKSRVVRVGGGGSITLQFFVTTITKTKRFFMGALVGALFVRNINKTNNKQHVNRGYDSESATFSFLCFPMNPYAYAIQQVSVKIFPDAF